jgi:hypothetical protein
MVEQKVTAPSGWLKRVRGGGWPLSKESIQKKFSILPTLLFSTLYSIVVIFLYRRSHLKEIVS